MTSETYSRKRYVSVCLGCRTLFDTVRRDQMTCSSACRVKAHRNGEIANRRALADECKVAPASIGHAIAVDLLLPDQSSRIMAGAVTIDDVMPELVRAFDRLVFDRAVASRRLA